MGGLEVAADFIAGGEVPEGEVLPGHDVGPGAVVGAGSVVVKDVAPVAFVVGYPARAVRRG